jgi:hypothetical protein
MPYALPAYQVHVQVENDLPTVCAGVDDQAVAGSRDPFLFGKLFGDREESTHQGFVLGQNVIDRDNVFDRYDQEMGGRDRVEVTESDDFFIFINDGSRRFPFDDLTKDAIVHVASLGLGWPNYK